MPRKKNQASLLQMRLLPDPAPQIGSTVVVDPSLGKPEPGVQQALPITAKKAAAVSTAETAAEAATVAAAPAAAGPTDSISMELEPRRGNAVIAAFQAQVQAEGYHIHHHAYADGALVNCLPRRSHIQQYERDCLARGFGGELVIRSFGSKAQDCRKADGLLQTSDLW